MKIMIADRFLVLWCWFRTDCRPNVSKVYGRFITQHVWDQVVNRHAIIDIITVVIVIAIENVWFCYFPFVWRNDFANRAPQILTFSYHSIHRCWQACYQGVDMSQYESSGRQLQVPVALWFPETPITIAIGSGVSPNGIAYHFVYQSFHKRRRIITRSRKQC